MRTEIEEEPVIPFEFLGHVLVAHRLRRLTLLRVEAENIGERRGLDVLWLCLLQTRGGFRSLQAGFREWRRGFARDGLRDGADLIEAESDGLGCRFALQDAVAQGGFLGRFFHGRRTFSWFPVVGSLAVLRRSFAVRLAVIRGFAIWRSLDRRRTGRCRTGFLCRWFCGGL